MNKDWGGGVYQCFGLHPWGQQRVKSISTQFRNEYGLGGFTNVLAFTRVGSKESNSYLHCTEMNMDLGDLTVSKPTPVWAATSQIHIYTVQKWIWTWVIYQCLSLHPVGSNKSNPYLHCTEMNMDLGDLPMSKPLPVWAATSQIHIYTVQKWIWTWVIYQCLSLHPVGSNESNPYLHCTEMNMGLGDLPMSKPSPGGQQRVKSISTLYRNE